MGHGLLGTFGLPATAQQASILETEPAQTLHPLGQAFPVMEQTRRPLHAPTLALGLMEAGPFGQTGLPAPALTTLEQGPGHALILPLLELEPTALVPMKRLAGVLMFAQWMAIGLSGPIGVPVTALQVLRQGRGPVLSQFL